MLARNRVTTTGLARTRTILVAALLLLVGVPAGAAEAQADGRDSEPAEHAVEETAEVAAPDRPVLTNAVEIGPLVQKWYRALDVTNQLGEGEVVVLLRVEPDGSVSRVRVVRSDGGHPVLNALARRAARRMLFSPAKGEAGAGSAASARWIHQRISFVR